MSLRRIENKEIPQKANILLVNDKSEQLLVLETILAPLNQNLVTSISGREALDILMKQPDFAVILLDVKMPEMDGFETAALIRQDKKTEAIPIIFFTAMEFSLSNQFTGYSLGAVDYILSPVEPEILRSKVKALLELYQKKLQVSLQAENLKIYNENLKKEIGKRKHTEYILQEKNIELKQEIKQRIQAEAALIQNERKFRQLAENIQDVFWIASLSFEKFIYVSPFYEKIWQRTVDSLYHNPNEWFETIHPEDRECVSKTFFELTHSRSSIILEYKIIRPDGTMRWIYNRGFPVLDELGNLYRIAGIATDVTERKELEELAFQQKYHLELAELARVNSMGEMASTLAHEFNQPLTAILTYTQTCIRQLQIFLSGAQKKRLDVIQKVLQAMMLVAQQAKRAGEVLHTMKNFVRKGDLSLKSFNVNEIILGLKSLIGYEVHRIEVAIQFQITDPLPLVYLDKIQIEQVLLNLIRNAIESMIEAKTPNPQLIIKTELHPDNMIIISVIDNGLGFPESKMNTLFDPYVTTKKSGTGMGLAISRTIIEAHGGQLSAKNNERKGACFSFTLPIPQGRLYEQK